MEREHINPTGIYKHPAFTRIVTVKGPMKMIFIAGQTPSLESCWNSRHVPGLIFHVRRT